MQLFHIMKIILRIFIYDWLNKLYNLLIIKLKMLIIYIINIYLYQG